jgi:transketolase
LVWKSIEAAKVLEAQGVSVELINMHTIKPLDKDTLLKSISKTKCVVTAEEHMIAGGLGESVAQVITQNLLVPQEFVAVNDSFGESGTPMELMTKYHIDTQDVIDACLKVIRRK